MKDVIAIVEPAIDLRQLSRDIAREHIALQDTDRKVEANATQGDALRKRQAQHRLEMGWLLIEAKKQIAHGKWHEFLLPLGIPPRTATEWMDESKSAHRNNCADSPKSRKERQADRAASNSRTRNHGSVDEPVDIDEQPDPPEQKSAPEKVRHVADLSQTLTKIMTTASDLARKSKERERALIAYNLHETAKLIEEMQ